MDSISKFFLLGILLTILLSIKYIYDAIINKEWSDLFLLLVIFPIFNWVSVLYLINIILENITNYVNNKKNK